MWVRVLSWTFLLNFPFIFFDMCTHRIIFHFLSVVSFLIHNCPRDKWRTFRNPAKHAPTEFAAWQSPYMMAEGKTHATKNSLRKFACDTHSHPQEVADVNSDSVVDNETAFWQHQRGWDVQHLNEQVSTLPGKNILGIS